MHPRPSNRTDVWAQAPFVQPKPRGQALHGQLSEGLQHVDLHDYILHDHIFRNTINHWWDRYLRLQQIRGKNHWWDRYLRFTIKSEICGSTSTQLVQLSTPFNIPGVSMVRNTGDSEDYWNFRIDNRIRSM